MAGDKTKYKHIALSGLSGSGKSVVSTFIKQEHGYSVVSSGQLCRKFCKELFGNEDRSNLNLLSTKLRELDENIWIDATLRNIPDGPIIYDSVRYLSDALYLRERGFSIWRIETPLQVCIERLKARGQFFELSDFSHESEMELLAFDFDFTINNDGKSLNDVQDEIAKLLDGDIQH